MSDIVQSYNTIGSFGQYGSQLNISHDKIHLKSSLNSNNSFIIVNSVSLPNKYFDYILDMCYTTALTNKELLHFKFQPKLYCFETFGTTELWSLLLKVNNWTSVTEFNKLKFKTFTSKIFDILNEIMILESENIAKNKESINY